MGFIEVDVTPQRNTQLRLHPESSLLPIASGEKTLHHLAGESIPGEDSPDCNGRRLHARPHLLPQVVDRVGHLVEEELWLLIDGRQNGSTQPRVVADVISMTFRPVWRVVKIAACIAKVAQVPRRRQHRQT